MKRIFFVIFAAALLQLNSFSAFAEQQLNLDDDGIILHGYDPVSYFTGEPAEGSRDITYDYKGGRYLFVTQENLEKFVSNPEKYRFAYGGYCAWAMLEGEKVDVDPERFKKINGVIYLFYNTFFTDTLEKWNALAEQESEKNLIAKADEWWKQITGK